MADTITSSSTTRSQTLTAMFDTQAEAERAVARLRDVGVPDSSIRLTAGDSSYDASTYSGQNKGFWESLGDFFFPDEDRYTYAEGLSRGAYLVAVTNFDESLRDQIVDVLDDEGSVDLSAREQEWRGSGWTDYRGSDYYDENEYARGRGLSTAAAGMGAAAAGALGGMPARGTVYDDGMAGRDASVGSTERVGEYQLGGVGSATGVTGSDIDRVGAQATRADDLTDSDYARTTAGTAGTAATGAALTGEEGRLQVVEEQLRVGKRSVEEGSVRVRSYVREEPVSAEVDLRSTRVFVERRPVDRAAGAADVAFQDRTIEARSYREEPVVQKEARVVEEIGLRQEAEVRQETVSDTVRRTEVEIEDERTGEVQRITGDATDADRSRT